MSVVRCDNIACKNNGGLFCAANFVFIKGGVCGFLIDRNGQWKPPQEWQRTSAPPPNDSVETQEQKPNS